LCESVCVFLCVCCLLCCTSVIKIIAIIFYELTLLISSYLDARLQLADNAKDLLRGMLERKVADRVGCGPTGANEMKRKPFLALLDFNKVLSKSYKVSFVPPASTSQTDVRNFDKEFTDEFAADSPMVCQMTETMQEKSNFVGFTFENDHRMK
jgi:hypothetical protein